MMTSSTAADSASGTSTNWKNVNNWHWVEKNCLPWAQEYLGGKLKGLEVKQGSLQVEVDSVTSVSGDVDLNQRKGKVITIYDLSIKLDWKGRDSESDKEAKGTMSIPEFMHDSDDLEFEVTVESADKERTALKELARKELTKVVQKTLLTSFSKDLVQSHSKDVYIAPEAMQGHPTLGQYQPKPPVGGDAKSDSTTGNEKVLGSLVTVHQSIEFVCSAEDLYDVLVNPQKVIVWSRGSQNPPAEVGKEFSLFGGNVVGHWKELIPQSKIRMMWRLKKWPQNHFSDVTLEFVQGDQSTTLKLTQKGIPIGDKDLTESNWKSYYWNAIMGSFGYGAHF